MLTPEELNTLHLNITKYYNELEEYTISDIARRIAKSEAITETALHQIRALQNMNLDLSNIEKKIKEIQKISDKELDKLYDEAIKRNNEFNDSIREKADLFPYVPDKTNQMFMLANALKEQTKNDLWNFTQSLGFAENIGGKTAFKPIAQFYQDTLNFAQMQIQSGVADYNTAIKQAVNKLAKSGLRTVDYESGYSSKIETAVRRAVLTGISQLSGEMTKQVMKEFNTDLVEVSAHQGARDKGIGPENHKLWQGKVYSLSGKNKKYPSLVKVTGYGTGEGLKGWNCRHDFFPFIEGVSERTYTDEELENIDPAPFEYEGKTYTAYEATQMQRKLETAMRNEKLKIVGYESSGLEDEMTSSSIRLRRLKNYYEDFSSKAGLKTQYERTQAAGWGKSIAQKSNYLYKRNTYEYYKGYLGTSKINETIDKLKEIDYNGDRWLLDGFVKAVDKGDISVLTGFDLYTKTARNIEKQLIGLRTKNGVEIKGYVTHFVDRVIGQVSEPHKGKRTGVEIEQIRNALLTPIKIEGVVIKSNGKKSICFIGDSCEVSINPETNKLIQTNPKRR